MGKPLDKLTIRGFKSIKNLKNFELRDLNVLIGANGAGKSNFVDFFRMMRAMMGLSLPDLPRASLQTYVLDGGGSDDFLFNGPKVTRQIEVEMFSDLNGYRFRLVPTANELFTIYDEAGFSDGQWQEYTPDNFEHNNEEYYLLYKMKSDLSKEKGKDAVTTWIYDTISSLKIYHFNDTGKFSPMRRSETVDDYKYLRFDGANIAPFLYNLKNNHEAVYRRIVNKIRLVAPFFEDFILEPGVKEKIKLLWHQKGSDYPMKPYHLSDGTIRFICLITALLQPDSPSMIIIDEPELGLHPYAIDILTELIQSASTRMQIVVSTQSSALVDNFSPEDIIVVSRKDGASTFERLKEQELSLWLEDYSLGELWRKNVIAGGPVYE